MTEYLKPQMSGEQMMPIIEFDRLRHSAHQNRQYPQHRQLGPGVPTDFAVEVPALVSTRGIQGIQTGGLPPLPLAYLLRDRVVPVELELEAYDQGSRRLLEELVCLDPWTKSTRQARDFIDELFQLEYHADMAAHYR